MPPKESALGELVRRYRDTLGISQKDLDDRLGVALPVEEAKKPGYVGQLENGRIKQVPAVVREALASVLGAPIDQIEDAALADVAERADLGNSWRRWRDAIRERAKAQITEDGPTAAEVDLLVELRSLDQSDPEQGYREEVAALALSGVRAARRDAVLILSTLGLLPPEEAIRVAAALRVLLAPREPSLLAQRSDAPNAQDRVDSEAGDE